MASWVASEFLSLGPTLNINITIRMLPLKYMVIDYYPRELEGQGPGLALRWLFDERHLL